MPAPDLYDYDICIVGLKCWDIVSGAEEPRYIGGIETDLVTLARLLADQGKRVALIVYDEGQPEVVNVDGIAVFRTFSVDAGLPLLRFLFPRATGMFRTISRIRARYVVQMGAGVETGWTGIATKWFGQGRKFVFLAGSDMDCMASLPHIGKLRERFVYRLGLRMADSVLAQTDSQADLLKSDFGTSADVLRLPNSLKQQAFREVSDSASAPRRNQGQHEILWVGRTDKNKRPHWMFEVARQYPDYRINMVGEANVDDAYSHEFRARAADFGNIVLHGKISRNRLARLYETADLLCCTSEFEGFPATFLEAWSFGLPTISTVDPGGYISRHQAGSVVASTGELVVAASPAMLDQWAETWSRNAERLYVEHFSPQACLRKFDAALETIK